MEPLVKTPAELERASLLEQLATAELIAANAEQDREEAVADLRAALATFDPIEAPVRVRALAKLIDDARSRVNDARREIRALREDLRRCDPGDPDPKGYLARVVKGELPATTAERIAAARYHLVLTSGEEQGWTPCDEW